VRAQRLQDVRLVPGGVTDVHGIRDVPSHPPSHLTIVNVSRGEVVVWRAPSVGVIVSV
jgi:hypothetical protein